MDNETKEAISDQIKSLESELRKNPNYVDLQAELARSYLEYSRLLWNKGVDRFSRTAEANRSLDGVSYALEEAEKVQQRIDVAIGKIAEKG